MNIDLRGLEEGRNTLTFEESPEDLHILRPEAHQLPLPGAPLIGPLRFCVTQPP